jgi:ferredoxin-NADP reductase
MSIVNEEPLPRAPVISRRPWCVTTRSGCGLVRDPRQYDVSLCGPAAWMDLVHRSLLKAGVPRHNIHDGRFSW